MLKTKIPLVNEGKIIRILQEMVQKSFEQIKDEAVLLCLECSDVDLYVATSSNHEFEEAVKENFALDEFGEILDDTGYRELMYDLHDYFVELHKMSGLFDYFPEGTYTVNGEKRESETDTLAPKGKFFAPFEDALSDAN